MWLRTASGGIRTHDLLLTKQTLYHAEPPRQWARWASNPGPFAYQANALTRLRHGPKQSDTYTTYHLKFFIHLPLYVSALESRLNLLLKFLELYCNLFFLFLKSFNSQFKNFFIFNKFLFYLSLFSLD